MPDPILTVVDVHKSFGALKASDGISLDLYPGEIHALIGPNGAGKSTLIKQIAGGMSPDSGSVHFLGRDVSALSTVDRAVLENAVLGAVGQSGGAFRFFRPAMKDKALLARAHAALEQVELTDHAQTVTAELSHGQRRQLEVAVALTLSPKAFLMDEPMAGMGGGGSKRLTEFLRELKHEAPILLVEHDMDAVFALADRISVLVYGKIIATGSVEDIRANPEVQLAYLGEEEAS